jgi:hypothetical protein
LPYALELENVKVLPIDSASQKGIGRNLEGKDLEAHPDLKVFKRTQGSTNSLPKIEN